MFHQKQEDEPQDLYAEEERGLRARCGVCHQEGWRNYIIGQGREITIDSAAEESVCPKEWGGAFPLKEPKKRMNFKTASGQDMQHYGERVVTCITESRPGPKICQGFPRHP